MGFNGKRLKYKLNGLYAFLVSVVLLLGLWFCGVLWASGVTDRLFALVTAGMSVALMLSLAVPVPGHDTLLRTCVLPQHRIWTLDWAEIDVKQFVMVRIGFIGWALMDLNYLLSCGDELALCVSAARHRLSAHLHTDFLIDEASVLTTKEFTEEPIGFIMILGEFIWIPFFSSLPVYFLLQRPNHIHVLSAVPICLMFGIGFLIYYLSNEQKDGFRRNPNDPAYASLRTIQSPSGHSLLASGWFGWVRHPNYFGDILMMFAWCFPCGFTSVLPYLPALQCFNLLRRRASEIEDSCLKKHGNAWQEYCRRVPYKLLPYVY